MKKRIILNLVILLIITSLAPAVTRLVPDGYPTIQSAINDCNDGDMVIVADGTYTGEGNRDIDFLGKAITVKGNNGAANCIIDCQGSENEPHRGFIFLNNEGPNSVITGLTIRNGYALRGGGIYCLGFSSPTISSCIIKDNEAPRGGGISTEEMGHCSPIIKNCLITGNSADYGGGISFSGDTYGRTRPSVPCYPQIINCTIIGNFAIEQGGGICSNHDCDVTVNNNIICGNTAERDKNIGISLVCDGSNSICRISYSDVEGGLDGISIYYFVDWGKGNIDVDPLFIDAAGGDYHLTADSPCINIGDPNYLPQSGETDLDGRLRIKNKIVDMGAYEFGPDWYVNGINGDDNNDGRSPETAFATIQKGINSAENDEIVLVYPGVYQETIDFLGKAITVQSAEDVAVLQTQDYFAVLFCNGEGPGSILKNFVIENSFMAIFIDGSSPTISNVTIVGNGFGIAAYAGSVPNISNSIFWNNAFGDLFGCQATYSCVQNGCAGPGNLDIDPRFADPEGGDYHLQSKHGRYWPQFDIWVLDEAFSPCIDGGDPNTDYCSEPMPNGGRVNMGAYGGTAYASKKEMRWLHSDTNKDGWVNMMDFAMIALDWLKYEPGTSNLPPEVSIIKPQDGDSFPPWESESDIIEIEAEAWDSDGSVEWMEFLANGDVIGEDSNGADGWRTDWQVYRSGEYNLTAEATDDDGETATSPAIEIRLKGGR